MLISREQIRAARAMMDWSQDALATECGLSLATIHNLEKGHVSMRSMIEVRRALENNGFEFLGSQGINRRSNEIRSYVGADSCDQFFDDVLRTIQETHSEIYAQFPSQEMLAYALGATNPKKRERLEQLAALTSVKCLLSQAHQSSLCIPCFEFRALTNFQGFSYPTLTMHDKTVIAVPQSGNKFVFSIIISMDVAARGRTEFEQLWNAAIPLSAPTAPQRRRVTA